MRALLVLAAVLLAACGAPSGTGAGSSGGAGPVPTPTATAALTTGDMRYAIVDHFGPRWYCDPDQFPVSRGNDLESAKARWGEVTASGDLFSAILRRHGLPTVGPYTDDQKLTVYEDWKVLVSIPLDPAGPDRYRFDYLSRPDAEGHAGVDVVGTIDAAGTIAVERQDPATEPMCPICLALGTRIDTPSGSVAVQDLRLGDAVWTLDAAGRRVEAVVIAVGAAAVPATHRVVRVELADGRVVTASPGHPLPGGGTVGGLRPGDLVDGSAVEAVTWLRYAPSRTYDLAVSGPTGIYLAGGVPLLSTLVSR